MKYKKLPTITVDLSARLESIGRRATEETKEAWRQDVEKKYAALPDTPLVQAVKKHELEQIEVWEPSIEFKEVLPK